MHPILSLLSLVCLTSGLVAACAETPAPAPAPTLGAEPSVQASASTRPTIVRGSLPPPRMPSSTATPAATTPTPEAPLPAGTTTVSGLVTSESGNPLYGAGVSVQSLDPKKPYSDRVIAEKGRYTITGVPIGINIKVAANIRFHDPRSIMHTTSADPAANVVDFVGPLALPKL